MKNLRGYIVSSVFGMLTVLFVLTLQDTWTQNDNVIIMKNFSDAFCVAGVLIGGVGLLTFISNDGFFDMLSYSFKKMTNVFRSNPEKKLTKSYYEYKLEKREYSSTFGFLLIVAAVFIVVALIFVGLYYVV